MLLEMRRGQIVKQCVNHLLGVNTSIIEYTQVIHNQCVYMLTKLLITRSHMMTSIVDIEVYIL